MSIEVTIRNLDTGSSESLTVTDDVLVITEGSAEVTNVQHYPKSGTQVFTVKGIGGRRA